MHDPNFVPAPAGNAFFAKFGIAFCESSVPEVCAIYCATANPVEVIVADTGNGRGILGVVDGVKSKGIETESDVETRKQMLRKFGYKL